MPDDVTRRFNNGLVTSRDSKDLGDGELQLATGVYYKKGDPARAWKVNGRSLVADTGTGEKIKGLKLTPFDGSGLDLLVAYSGDTLYGAEPLSTFPFITLETGLTGDTLSAAHANDRWYLATGKENRVLEADQNVRNVGMVAPQSAPLLSALVQGSEPDVNCESATGFANNANAEDGDVATFAHKFLSTPGETGSFTCDWGLAGATGVLPTSPQILCTFGWSPGSGSGFREVDYDIEYSEDSGSTWLRMATGRFVSAQDARDITVDYSGTIQQAVFRVNVEFLGGTPSSFTIHRVQLVGADSDNAPLDAENIKYAFAEFDEDRGLTSNISPIAKKSIAISPNNENGIRLALPTTVQNSNTTHWLIYRGPPNGTDQQLGLRAQIEVNETAYLDYFDEYPPTPALTPTVPLLEQNGLFFPRDTPPGPMRRLRYFRGSLVGLSDETPRGLYYSVPGLHESWPGIYVIESFPLEEHDELIDCVEVGTSLVVAARAAMFRMDDLPLADTLSFTPPFVIRGAPGCVGDYALTAIPFRGESQAAWISQYDIRITNGHSQTVISDELDWTKMPEPDGSTVNLTSYRKSGWVLHWDRNRRVLVFVYSSTGQTTNDRFMLCHVDPLHLKQNGQPKWTGPHVAKISDMSSGQTQGVHRIYSGDFNGAVYREDDPSTGSDASNAWNLTGTSLMRIKTGRVQNGSLEYAVHDMFVFHSDFGSGQTAELLYKVGRYSSNHENTKTISMLLENEREQLDIARSGDYHEMTITHEGTGLGAFDEMVLRAEALGPTGVQK